MPSEIAKDIVDKIFGDDKAKALDLTNDALSATTYDLVQQQKLQFAKSMGFDLKDTAQDAADEVQDSLPDGQEAPTEVEVDGRKPEDPPETPEAGEEVPDPLPPNTAVVDSIEPIEEPTDETNS